MKVARAMKLGHDGISHAAIDMLCTLMEPMHEDYDLKQVSKSCGLCSLFFYLPLMKTCLQEQLNKSSLLSSERFLDSLLDMWTTHVVSLPGFYLTELA